MNIKVTEDPAATTTEVVIRCRALDEEVMRVVSALSSLAKGVTGDKDGKTFVIDPADICYAESVDKHTFIYTDKEVFSTPLRLYELEERLGGGFFRSSKSQILQVRKIRSIAPEFGGRLVAVLMNGEKQIISRQYVPVLKGLLGMK